MKNYLKALELGYRRFIPKRLGSYRLIRNYLKGLSGIEIGGPTSSFEKKGFLPIYESLFALDNVNFNYQTVWEGKLTEGNKFRFGNKTGHQFIREATDLTGIGDNHYSFLLSSHNIEHLANPLRAIQEWKRVVKPNGFFLFVLPNKDGTFDHRRPITTIEHLQDDLTNNTTESDETHFNEVLALHDLRMDPGRLNAIDFKLRTLANLENRCVHHHVFDLDLLAQIAEVSAIDIILLEKFSKMHLVLLGKNVK